MALKSIRGVYRNGQIELEEKPDGIQEAQVIVTFLSEMDDSERARLKDYEYRLESSEAMIRWAMVNRMVRWLTST